MTRIRITGGPWPERIGCEGVIVPAPAVAVYPWHGRGKCDVIVLLDHDPVAGVGGEFGEVNDPRRTWTCCMSRSDVEHIV